MKKVLLFCILFCFNLFLIAEEISVQKLKEFSTIFRDIAKKVSPSVVSIEVSKTVEYIEDPYGLNRFFNLDTNTYAEGALPVKTKEMLGLVASMVLRCDDCIKYHLGKSFELGVTTEEMYEIFAVANIVGGTIVIPHTRRAAEYWEELIKQ